MDFAFSEKPDLPEDLRDTPLGNYIIAISHALARRRTPVKLPEPTPRLIEQLVAGAELTPEVVGDVYQALYDDEYSRTAFERLSQIESEAKTCKCLTRSSKVPGLVDQLAALNLEAEPTKWLRANVKSCFESSMAFPEPARTQARSQLSSAVADLLTSLAFRYVGNASDVAEKPLAESKSGRVTLLTDRWATFDNAKVRLHRAEYDAVMRLCKVSPEGLGKSEWGDNNVKAAVRLRDRSEDAARLIQFPGGKNSGGYRVL